MNKIERKKMIIAMEYIARQINDEDIFEGWLISGVPDGDIEYGDFNPESVDDYLIEDKTFSQLMGCFLRIMASARHNGGLYCDHRIDNNDN